MGLFASRTRFTHVRAHLIAFCSRLETASGVMSCNFIGPIVPDKRVNFRDPRSNRYREIPPEAVGVNDYVTFGDSRSNRSRDIRLSHLTIDGDDDASVRRSPDCFEPSQINLSDVTFRTAPPIGGPSIESVCLLHVHIVAGILMRTSDNPDSADLVSHAPFTLFPTPVPRRCFRLAETVQTDFNLLVHRVATNHEFLYQCLERLIWFICNGILLIVPGVLTPRLTDIWFGFLFPIAKPFPEILHPD